LAKAAKAMEATAKAAGDGARAADNAANLIFNGCFVADTVIHTDKGEKTIQTFAVGDMVYACNVLTGEIGLKPVTKTYTRTVDGVVKVTTGGQTITTTLEHPFWVEKTGWVKAGKLVVGDRLKTLDGRVMAVDSIAFVQERVPVYNIEVDDWHSYYVGPQRVLVHNNPCPVPGTGEYIKVKGHHILIG